MTSSTATSQQAVDDTAEAGAGGSASHETPPGSPWNAIEDAFLKRRSVRRYRKKQVPEHYIRRILEVARYAPSHGNCQPWKFIVVRDPAVIKEMEESVGQFMQAGAAPASGAGTPSADPPAGMHPVPFRLMSQGPPGEDLGLFWDAPSMGKHARDVPYVPRYVRRVSWRWSETGSTRRLRCGKTRTTVWPVGVARPSAKRGPSNSPSPTITVGNGNSSIVGSCRYHETSEKRLCQCPAVNVDGIACHVA